MKPLLYWHTLRHLKWAQVAGRVAHRLRRLDVRPPGGLCLRMPQVPIGIDPWRTCALDMEGCFAFLNESRVLPAAGGWNDASAAKLWLYNLHYFDWINAHGREDDHIDSGLVLAWMRRWIRENPAPAGNGWEPYPLSLRIVNWVRWLSVQRAAPPSEIAESLMLQAYVLAQQVETHLLGNHLFENAKALMFAGSVFEGEAAGAWFRRGAKILDAELDEQIMPDGGYFELSPMYHAIVLEGVFDLLALQQAWPELPWEKHGLPASRLQAKAQAMLAWLEVMTHPDGRIALFNDAAFGVAPDTARLCRYAERLGVSRGGYQPADGVRWLADSGYARVDRGDSAAFLDLARIGPDYLPGHAHADTLSFEWSLGPHRLLVNGGTSVYGTDPERNRQRGTASHNTVLVDGQDSSEVWSGFRVARRAYPREVRIDQDGPVWRVHAAHDGYCRLPGRVVHRRRWEFGDDSLIVADCIEGRHRDAWARFHLHPAVRVEQQADPCSGRLALPDGRRVNFRIAKGEGRLENATYHPAFGVTIPTRCLAVALEQGESTVAFDFS